MNRRNVLKTIFSVLCLLILILDAKTALRGANDGITLCITSIIPTLLPFSVLSKLLCSTLLGKNIPILRHLGMPKGTESIFLISLIGGYPIGAQCIDDAYKNGHITIEDARRMLGFCNNAGPAFLFGILGHLFPNAIHLWSLFVIHILSAHLVGIILPQKSRRSCILTCNNEPSLAKSVEESAKALASVCCWIILFRILLAFIQRWIGWMLTPTEQVIISGILELSNGCIALQSLNHSGTCFILASLFLSFGGGCVALQTVSVAKHCGIGEYFKGKILQSLISVFLATAIQSFLFCENDKLPSSVYLILIGCLGVLVYFSFFLRQKKVLVFAR